MDTFYNFINIHILVSLTLNSMNRDEQGQQKDGHFGGVRRGRHSSQSLKAAIRGSSLYRELLGAPSIRTGLIADLADRLGADHLRGEFPPDLIAQVLTFMLEKTEREKARAEQRRIPGRKKPERAATEPSAEVDADLPGATGDPAAADGGSASADPGEGTAAVAPDGILVFPWSVPEIRWYCAAIQAMQAEGLAPQQWPAQLRVRRQELRQTLNDTVDIALAGRTAVMGAIPDLLQVDAALSVAHEITTHALAPELDWFTAQDDLRLRGAGHINTTEFSSGTFYRFAAVNLRQLQLNLGFLSSVGDEEPPAGRRRALEIAAHLVRLFALVHPAGRQANGAAYNPAHLVLVTLGELPLNLANAFERPVTADPDGGFMLPSVMALHTHWAQVHRGYGVRERAGEWRLDAEDGAEDAVDGITTCATFARLQEWVENVGMSPCANA